MHNSRRLPGAVILLVVFLATSNPVPHWLSPMSVVGAANQSLPLQNLLTRKGFVTTKAERSMTVLEGSSAIQVVVTEKTQVTGQRDSFARIVVDDLVRIEVWKTADRNLLADRIEVLLAADSMTVVQRRRTGPASGLLSVILNGGIIVPLP